MAAATTDLRDRVVKVINSCLGGAHGFEAAANAINDTACKKELALLGRKRRVFTTQLQTLLEALGDSAIESNTTGAGFFAQCWTTSDQGWVNPGQVYIGDTRDALLAECERGEVAAIEAYRQVLDEPLPEVTRQIIASQFRDMLRSHERIKALCGVAR